MKEFVRVAVVGLGGRGLSLLKLCLLRMHEDVEVVAVCDIMKIGWKREEGSDPLKTG